MSEEVTRKLTAILAADVAGYSRLMGEDEAGTPTDNPMCRIPMLFSRHRCTLWEQEATFSS